MLHAIRQWMPKGQNTLYWGVLITWFSSLLFLLYTGGKLALLLFIITTILTAYLLLLGRFSGISSIKGHRISSSSKTRFDTGDTYYMETTFKIPGFWPIPYVLIKDHIHHNRIGTQVYESSFVPDFYRSGKTSYNIANLKRGSYKFEQTECSTTDLLDLFQHKSSLHLPKAFHVYPRTIHISNWPFVSNVRKGIWNSSLSRFQKETTEIDGIREYLHGDRLSIIHWNASAKTGELKSKEFIRESVPKILIVTDQFQHSYQDEEQFELAVSTAASIIRYSKTQQIPIGLFSTGKQMKYFNPEQSNAHHKQLEKHLLYIDANSEIRVEDSLLNRNLTRLQGGLIVVITPITSNELFDRLRGLKRMQLLVCHIWLSQVHNQDSLKWERNLQSENIQFYQVGSLAELPSALGGDKQ